MRIDGMLLVVLAAANYRVDCDGCGVAFESPDAGDSGGGMSADGGGPFSGGIGGGRAGGVAMGGGVAGGATAAAGGVAGGAMTVGGGVAGGGVTVGGGVAGGGVRPPCAPQSVAVNTMSRGAPPRLSASPDLIAVASSAQQALTAQIFNLLLAPVSPRVTVDPTAGFGVPALAATEFAVVSNSTPGTQARRFLFNGNPAGSVMTFAGGRSLNVTGVNWSGSTWGFGVEQTDNELVFERFGAMPLGTTRLSTSGTWISTAWNGRVFGYVWRDGSGASAFCMFAAIDPLGTITTAPTAIVTGGCQDPHISSRPGGFSVSYHNSGVRRPRWLRIDDTAQTRLGPVDVGPAPNTVQFWRPISASTPTHTFVAYNRYLSNDIWLTVYDTTGTMVGSPTQLTDVYGSEIDIASAGDRVALAWRQDISDGGMPDVFVRILCSP